MFVDHRVQTGILSGHQIGIIHCAEAGGHLHHADVGDGLVGVFRRDIPHDHGVIVRTFVQVALNGDEAVRPAGVSGLFLRAPLIDTHLADILGRGPVILGRDQDPELLRKKKHQGEYDGKRGKDEYARISDQSFYLLFHDDFSASFLRLRRSNTVIAAAITTAPEMIMIQEVSSVIIEANSGVSTFLVSARESLRP